MTNTLLTRLDAAETRTLYAAGHWRGDTIYSLVREAADAEPGKVAIRETSRVVTYRELLDAADRLAGELERSGLRRGERVAIWLPSRIETAVGLLACSRQRYLCCPSFHRDHTPGEVLELVARIRASALIAETGYGADRRQGDLHVGRARIDSLRLFLELPPAASAPGEAVLPGIVGANGGPATVEPDSVVYLAFTSGSTGTPKAAMHSDNTLLAPARAMASDWQLGPGSVVYTLSPLSHNLGFGAMVMALSEGGELVLHDLPRGASLVDRLLATRVNFLFGVPTHAIDLVEEMERRKMSGLGGVRGFRVSGAAIGAELAGRLLELGITPQSGYGMTEAGSHHYTRPADGRELVITTSGRPFSGYEVRIFSTDDANVEVPTGEVGQIGGRGASLMLGYFDDQAATEACFNRSGFFLTGDLGWVDEAGYLRITGREKDLIIRGGRNIYPAKIETLAMGHPLVTGAAAIAVPDRRLGEKVCLAVTTQSGCEIDPDDILEHLHRAGLSPYDMPEYLLRLDAMPLLASGKLFKRRLIEEIEEGTLTPTPIRFARR